MQQTRNADIWLWTVLAIGVLVARLFPGFAPALNQDSFQYLVAADNILAGHFGYTSLIHYDAERSFGTMPSPFLTFPLGYPLAIAALGEIGLSPQTAALLLSAVSTVACVPLIAWISARLDLSRAARNVVLACFVLNGIISEFGTAAMTEALFMFLVLLGAAALVSARLRTSAGDGAAWLWSAAGLAFGLSYFVRYVGLFFILGVALVALRQALVREWTLVKGNLLALAIASLFVLMGIARNFHFAGNWRGRDEMLVHNPLLPTLVQTVEGMNALILGVGTSDSAIGGTFIPKIALCLLLVGGLALLAWGRRRSALRTTKPSPPMRAAVGIDLLLLSASYFLCMLYAGLSSEISYGTSRTFVPVVPLLLLLFGWLLQTLLPPSPRPGIERRLAVGALVASLGFYVYLNVLVMRKPLIDQTAVVADRLSKSEGGNATPRSAILDRVGSHDVLLANNGQAVAYVLGRPTISMVGHTFGGMDWNETAVRETIQRFHVAAVVISAPIPGNPEADEIPSAFIRRLAAGNAPPWLKLEFRSSSMLVYTPIPGNT